MLRLMEAFSSCIQSKFDELDPEVLSAQVAKYGKYVNQLEKGLPPNTVVPVLKQKVEHMRAKVGESAIMEASSQPAMWKGLL